MARIACTPKLENIGPVEPVSCQGATVQELIDELADDYPRLKSYVLDDQGRVRKHIAIFIDGALQPRESVLACRVFDDNEVYIMQALSGG